MKDFIYEKLLSSRKIMVNASTEFRVNVIREEYIGEDFNIEELKQPFEKLKRYINSEKIDSLLELIKNQDYDKVIEELMINYYDNNYRCNDKEYEWEVYNTDNKELALKIINRYAKIDNNL